MNVPATLTNALTIDVEDYFQVSAFAPHIRRSEWNSRECRVERNVNRILATLSSRQVKATFFTLGWIAERYPKLIRQIAQQGHEIASHGYGHARASDQTQEAFHADIQLAKVILEDLCDTVHPVFPSARATCGPSIAWRKPVIATAPAFIPSSMITTACQIRPVLRIKSGQDCWRYL